MTTRRAVLSASVVCLMLGWAMPAKVFASDWHLDASTSLRALKNNPYLKAFASHLMPRPGDIDRELTLSEISQLMPWHGYINTKDILCSLNRLINDCAEGKQVFYSFYEDQNRADQTGLFFFRGKPTAPFALISPGGGFAYVGSLHEGFPIAQAISEKELNAFVIQYRIGGARIACEDLAHALSWIVNHAETLEVAPTGYSLWGGSAGARMAAYLGSYGSAAFGAPQIPRAATVVMQYTGHADYTNNDPPTYAIVSRNDPIADYETMRQRLLRLSVLGIPTKFRLCNYAGHGFGLGTGSDAEGWLDEAVQFWMNQLKDK